MHLGHEAACTCVYICMSCVSLKKDYRDRLGIMGKITGVD